MTTEQAKQLLFLYRPSVDAGNAEFAEAVALAQGEQELRSWFEQHCVAQAALRDQFRDLPVPPDLAGEILARHRVVVPILWRQPAWLTAAAALVLALGIALYVWQRPHIPDRFTDFRARMVRNALLQYRMDVVTPDLTVLQQFLGTNGAPVDFVVPNELQGLSLTGGGLLRWRGQKVSMACFDRGDKQMLFLFVVNRAAVKAFPPLTPRVEKVNKLLMTSWTRGECAYLLAGPESSSVFQTQP
jgi:hypothetical protein